MIESVTVPQAAPDRRVIRRRAIKGVLAIAAFTVAFLATKRVSMEEDAKNAGTAFDAATYVTERWASEILPALVDEPDDLATLISALDDDAAGAAAEFGHSSGAGNAYSFAVTGTGVAGEVQGSAIGLMVAGIGADHDVYLQVGPAINGTALRDATGLVSFDQFLNQIEYQEVANQMNARIKEDPLGDIDPATLVGQTVTFIGAFTQNRTGLVSIVPVALEVSE